MLRNSLLVLLVLLSFGIGRWSKVTRIEAQTKNMGGGVIYAPQYPERFGLDRTGRPQFVCVWNLKGGGTEMDACPQTPSPTYSQVLGHWQCPPKWKVEEYHHGAPCSVNGPCLGVDITDHRCIDGPDEEQAP